MNKFESFIPLMHEKEYKFIEKFLTSDDIFLEWGSGNSTIYYSGIVKKVISIEHDIDYYNQIKKTIDIYNINNIDLIYIPPQKGKERKDQLLDYINYPTKNKLNFTKVLIDGRGRKYCAESLKGYIDKNVIVFIHDFNYNNVEGSEDLKYFEDILSVYNIVERVTEGQGIVALEIK